MRQCSHLGRRFSHLALGPHPVRGHLIATFFAMLVACALNVQANMICFSVDCPLGSGIGVPVGIGHVFVEMTPESGPQANKTFGYGFYPSTKTPFPTTGKVKNDTTHGKDFTICYEVTDAQFNKAVDAINARKANPGTYNVLTNNCVDFASAVAAAAGITLPNTVNGANVSDPASLCISLKAIGDDGGFKGGIVNTFANLAAPGQPSDYSYASMVDDGHMNPGTLADYAAGGVLNSTNLGVVNANSITGLSVTLTNADLANSVTSINWGDGSPYQDQASTFSHVYSPGTYNADFFELDAGAVQAYQMTVDVSSSAAMNQSITLASFSPTSVDNSGSGDFLTPPTTLDEVPEPATAGLLLIGTGILALRRVRSRGQKLQP